MPVKVLIAHNNTQRLKQAVTDLHAAGFEVVATPDGGDAFARFFEEEPQVVICSLQLPSLAGENIARMVRAQSPQTEMVLLVDREGVQVDAGVKLIMEPMTLQKLREAMPEIAFEAPQASDEQAADLTAASPTRVFVHAVLKRFQRDNRALQALDDAGISKMAAIAENRNFSDGERIILQGDPGDGFYLVCEGQVRVTLAEKEDKEVARISAGGFFGEMAMLLDQKRSASVWSAGPTTLLWFGRDVFMPTLLEYPSMREVLSGVALKRTEENLWRVLFDDDEVQRSLAQLDVAAGPQEDAPAPQAPVAPKPEPEKPAPQPVQPQAFKKTIAPSAVLLTPAEAEAQEAVGYRALFEKHRFEAGVGAGFLGAMLLIAIISLFRGPSEPEKTVIVTPVPINTVEQAKQPAPEPPKKPDPGKVDEPKAEQPKADEPKADQAKPDEPKPDEQKPEPEEDEKISAAEEPMAEAYKAGDFKRVLSLAKKIGYTQLDAGGDYFVADSLRHIGSSEALKAYFDFIKRHPTHSRADDAQFWAAELLAQQGKKSEARELYQKVAGNEKSNYRTSASKRLEK